MPIRTRVNPTAVELCKVALWLESIDPGRPLSFLDHRILCGNSLIGATPRLIDCGQCNDAYSAIQVAVALAKAFDCGVNDLPLSLILTWYEQKAVCILLTLLHLGIKNIRLGPTLPAFVSPSALNVLVEKFNIMPISTVEKDLAAILG